MFPRAQPVFLTRGYLAETVKDMYACPKSLISAIEPEVEFVEHVPVTELLQELDTLAAQCQSLMAGRRVGDGRI